MVDCEYRDDTVFVDGTSSLSRYATLDVSVLDTATNGLPNVEITVTDSLGQTVYTGKTDSSGFIPSLELLVSRHDQNGYQTYLPFTVRASYGTSEDDGIIRTFSWTQAHFVFESLGDTTNSVYVAGERGNHTAILRVIPQPVSGDGSITVETRGLDKKRITATLHNALGKNVWSTDGLRVVDNRIRISEFGTDLPAGFYMLRLHLDNGEIVSTKVMLQ